MKNFILLSLFLCIFNNANGQEVIEYDFAAGTFTKGLAKAADKTTTINKLKRLKNEHLVIVKVININTFRYEVSLKGTNINYVTQMPSELQTIFRQTNVSEKPVSDSAEEIAEQTSIMNQQKNKVVSFNSNVSDSNKRKELEKTMKDLVTACEKYLKEVNNVSGLEAHRIFLINSSKDKRSVLLPVDPNYTRDKMKKIYVDFVNAYAIAIANYEAVKNIVSVPANKNLLLSENVIDEAYKEIEKAHHDITASDVLKLIDDIDKLQTGLANKDNYAVISAPIQVAGDYLLIEGTIKPSPVADLMPFESITTFPIEIPVFGGTKVDFSVGPTVSIGKNAKDEKYFLEESTTLGKSYLRQRDNNNAGTPGLAAMMHIFRRNGKDTAIGGLFGVGAGFQTIRDVDLSFYGGASIILGKNQKVMINAGLSFLRVDRLKENEFVVGKEYTTENFDLGNVVEKVFKSSVFISLSYNLAKRVDN